MLNGRYLIIITFFNESNFEMFFSMLKMNRITVCADNHFIIIKWIPIILFQCLHKTACVSCSSWKKIELYSNLFDEKNHCGLIYKHNLLNMRAVGACSRSLKSCLCFQVTVRTAAITWSGKVSWHPCYPSSTPRCQSACCATSHGSLWIYVTTRTRPHPWIR